MSKPPHLLVATALLVALAAPAAHAQWVESDCTTLLTVLGTTPQETFGWQVLPLGDVDRDSVVDFVVSAPLSGAGSSAGGKVEVRSGADGSLVWSRTESLSSSILGYEVVVSDWNADGVLDVVASAPFNGPGGGHVRVYSGDDGTELALFDPGNVLDLVFGASLALGDFDGDGVVDLAIAAIGHDAPGAPEAGRVDVYSGNGGALIATIDAPLDAPGDVGFGIGLAFVGDVSLPPDGRAEIVIGHRDASFWSGSAHAYSYDGSTVQRLYSVAAIGMGFNLQGNRFDGGRDVDGDGFGDWLVRDVVASRALVYSGRDGTLLRTFDGNGEGGGFGTGTLIDDVDADGAADLLLGATANDAGATDGGRIHLYSGRSGALLRTLTATVAGAKLGRWGHLIAPPSADGRIDLVVSGAGGSTSGSTVGRFVVVRTRAVFSTYCIAKTTSSGCLPAMSASGAPSLASADGFEIRTGSLDPNRLALSIVGASGPAATPFQGGHLCAAPPFVRLAAQSTGGSAACSGSVAYTLSDLLASGPAGALLQPGVEIFCQTWCRDPGDAFGTGLSNGLRFEVLP